MRVHLIGIGGSGLSAIARLLLEKGYRVSGSDRQAAEVVRDLKEAGARVYLGHAPEHVQGADLVVRSSAVPAENVEVQAALAQGIPVVKRAEFVGQLVAGHTCVAVAGTHGKTTTTAMIAWVLTALGQDPSFLVGGFSENLGTNAHAGRGSIFVIEADEYDHMFLGLNPKLAVVTNVEYDHPDFYASPDDFHRAFLEFTARLTPDGTLLACSDDRGASRLVLEAADAGRLGLTYGLQGEPDYRARGLKPSGDGYEFEVWRHRDLLARLKLAAPGVHNVRNALATLAAVDLLGLSVPEAAQAMEAFRGVARRFHFRGEASGVAVIDDYAHHPTEIRATLAAARARYPARRLWAVWQPHTYSRTRALFADFITAFTVADRVLVTEVYAAREAVPADFSARQLVSAISQPPADFRPDLAGAAEFLSGEVRPGDVVLVMSAGDGDRISSLLLERLREREGEHV